MMKLSELRELSLDELHVRLSETEEELANFRFQLGSAQLDSPIRVRLTRRQVARIQTVIRAKELSANTKAEE